MADDYATLDDLKNRLEWTLDSQEESTATSALEDASDLARYYGRDWPVATAPRLVRTLVLKACKRYMTNPDGYTQSRAGDEAVGWSDRAGENAGTVYFTSDEIKLLRDLANRRVSIQTAPVVAWKGQENTPGYVPVDYGGDAFPLFSDSASPW